MHPARTLDVSIAHLSSFMGMQWVQSRPVFDHPFAAVASRHVEWGAQTSRAQPSTKSVQHKHAVLVLEGTCARLRLDFPALALRDAALGCALAGAALGLRLRLAALGEGLRWGALCLAAMHQAGLGCTGLDWGWG